MKKIVALLLCAVIMFTSSAVVFAKMTSVNTVEFYIQRFGMQMDEEGTVTSRDASYFTPCVYSGWLTSKWRDSDYTLVYREGVVSSDDILEEVTTKPNDAEIFEIVKSTYENKGYILSSNGKVVDWSKFNTDNYEIRWYVLKMEDIWHIDGVIVEIETKEPIQIPSEEDPDYIPPEEIEKEEDEDNQQPGNTEEGDNNTSSDVDDIVIPEYTSNYAYIYGYNDTTMGAEGSLLRSEVSAMIHRLVKQNNRLGGFSYNESAAPVFADIGGEWFRSAIEYMNYKGAFNAQPGGLVAPYEPVTRGETFKLVCIGLGFTDDTDLSLEDYAKIMYNAGYIQGDENGDLNISDLITRAEFCTIYNRVIGRDRSSLYTADGEWISAETYGFTDLSEDDWYYETMLKATSAYDRNGYVDIELRGIRNNLDDYE